MPLWIVRIFKTFSTFFGSFLSFFIPLMIVGFVVSGIAKLTEGAGKLLGFTAIVSYVSTKVVFIPFFLQILSLNLPRLKSQGSWVIVAFVSQLNLPSYPHSSYGSYIVYLSTFF